MKRPYMTLSGIPVGILLLCATFLSASADAVSDARSLMQEGDYDAARRVLEAHVLPIQPARRGGAECLLMAECLYELGRYAEARQWTDQARDRGAAGYELLAGRLAFLDYDFDEAARLYGRYAARKGGDPMPDSYTSQLETARRALSAVEQLEVVDSLAVDANDFLKAFRLHPSSGRLAPPSAIPFDDNRGFATSVYVSERGDMMMWAEPDTTGTIRLAESIRLTDGTWHEPVMLPESIGQGGDADFPFLMPDGVTLYYASDGDGSMGGLDLFVATRDAGTGEWLEPRNLGMPYNSPYDDFMLAIDEVNGIGMWATDRNLLGDKVTVYVYKVPEFRRNYDPDREDIIQLARLEPWREAARKAAESLAEDSGSDDDDDDGATDSDGDMTVDNALAATPVPQPEPEGDFLFPMPGGRVCRTLGDFNSGTARGLMERYLKETDSQREDEARLDSLRREYSSLTARGGRAAMAGVIADLETKVGARRETLRRMRSDIIRAETQRTDGRQ